MTPVGLQLVRHVGRFHRLVVEVSTDASSILIRSALDDHVQADAARAGLDVVSGRRDLDLFEVVVVEVRRGGAGGRHVRDLDAVQRPARILRPRALRGKVRLLTGLVATDVDAIDEHSRHTAHQRKRIARRGDFLELVGPEVRRRPRRLGVDDWRRAVHGHGFGNRRDLQLGGQIGRNADRNDDILPNRGREALEREAHLVLAWREIQEAEFACPIGDRIRGPVTAGDCDRDTRQNTALLVGHRSRQRAAPELRESRCCRG